MALLLMPSAVSNLVNVDPVGGGTRASYATLRWRPHLLYAPSLAKSGVCYLFWVVGA